MPLTITEAVDRLKENEARLNAFINDDTGYTTTGGQPVESVPAFLERVAEDVAQSTGTVAANLAASQQAVQDAQAARDAAQFHAGIYATTAAGLAATTNGQYFSVPSSANTALSLYKNNAGAAQFVNDYPASAVAKLGRVQFARRGTVFLFNDPAGTSVEVGWTTLRFWKGDNNFRRVADRPLSALSAGKALYIDVAADLPTTDYPVQEADLTAIAIDIVTGTKVLLVANYVDGYLVGEIAEALVNKELSNSIATVQASATSAATQARYGRSRLTASQSAFTYAFDSGTNTMTLSWTGLRLLRGDAGLAVVNDLTGYALANNKALYLDLTLASPLTAQEADYTAVAVDCVSGSKLLLVANYFGFVIGEIAGFLRSEQVEVKAETAQTNSNDSRRIVTGTVTSATPSGSSYVVSVSEGRSYKENNGGASEFKIAPLTDVTLAAGEGLVVDFAAGTKDASDRYIPVKYLVAQSAASGWQTGKKYVLVGNAGFGSLFGAYRTAPPATSAPRKIGVHDGKVAFSTSTGVPLPSYDPNTRTLSWPELVIPIKDRVAPLTNRIKLESGSITFPTGLYWVAALDLSQANYTLTPASAISIGNYFQGGWDGEDENWLPLFCVSNGVAYPVCFPPTVGSTTYPGSGQASSGYDPAEVVVVQRADEVDIFMKGSNPTSNRYLRYRMQRKPNATISSDVWRWNEVWEVIRTGDTSFSDYRQICNSGENEMAIQQTGKSDFMGGTAHGDEELFTATMLVDGAAVPLGGTGSFRCRRVEFLQGSDMYEVDTVPAKSNRVAKSYKRWVFEGAEVEVLNNIVWEDAITLSLTFMTMLTFQRWNGDLQISDRGYRAPLYLEEDISDSFKVTMGLGGTGFVNGETVTVTAGDGTGTGMEGTATVDGSGAVTAIKVTKNGTGYTIGEALVIASKAGAGSGATGTLAAGFSMVYTSANIAKASGPSGYSAEVELLDGWDKPNRRFNFSNSASYNKFYFDYTGPGYTTQVGEVFRSRARYKLDTRN